MKVRVDGLELHVVVEGRGEPILFVHGFPLSSALWAHAVRHLRADWRCIAPDLRGHGASATGADAGMPRLAADLVAILDALEETRPVVLVGLSMGGYVAMQVLRDHPERVRALVLADTRAEADTPEAARGRRELAARVRAEGSTVVAESMTGKLFAPGAPARLVEEWRARMAATPPEGIAAALLGMAERPDSLDVLGAWRRPLLLVVGEEDSITPPDLSRRIRQAVPGSRLEIVPGAGHLTPVEQPERFNSVLRSFLESLPPLE